MSELSVKTPSKRRMNPNSLANLRPPWQPGESGHLAGNTGPVVTPAMRRMSEMSLEELMALEPKRMKVGDLIAYRMLLKAATDEAWGDKTREEVLRRLDGPVSDGKGATAIAAVVNIIRGDTGLGMEPKESA